jgi:hypothetical protein
MPTGMIFASTEILGILILLGGEAVTNGAVSWSTVARSGIGVFEPNHEALLGDENPSTKKSATAIPSTFDATARVAELCFMKPLVVERRLTLARRCQRSERFARFVRLAQRKAKSNPPVPRRAIAGVGRPWSGVAAPPKPALTPPTGSSSETGSATGEAAIGVGASVTGASVGEATVGVTALRAVVGTASNVACVVLDADVAESVGRVAPTTVLAEREPGATVEVADPTSVEDVAGARREAVEDGEVVVV